MKKHLEYKIRFIIFVLLISGSLFLGIFLLNKTYSKYNSVVDTNVEISNAIYIFKEGTTNFNIDLNGIVPSESSYIYAFSISNFNNDKRSDVNIKYNIGLITTTNIPLTYQIYYGNNKTNIIDNYDTVQDEDGAWYNKFTIKKDFNMDYSIDQTDIFYLVVNYSIENKLNDTYSDCIDSIEVKIDSHQVVEGDV